MAQVFKRKRTLEFLHVSLLETCAISEHADTDSLFHYIAARSVSRLR
jgi:hypothetical protein